MTRFIHDQFSKDFLEALLAPYGVVKAPSRVAGEVKYIDVLFTPNFEQNAELDSLGLLGKFAKYPAIFEPFRNAATEDEISDCVLKVLEVKAALRREAKRNNSVVEETAIPKLWVLTPTASADILSTYKASEDANLSPGVHLIASPFRTAIVVIHDLPEQPQTLWLRILGRGKVQQKAIDEFLALPANNPFKKAALESLYNLQQNLVINRTNNTEDTELVMRLAPLYQQDRERAKQEGRVEGEQIGEQRLIIRQINRRFGEIDSSLIERIRSLSIEQLEMFGEALLDIETLTDLEAWLNQQLQ